MYRALAILIIVAIAIDYFMLGGQYTESIVRYVVNKLHDIQYYIMRIVSPGR